LVLGRNGIERRPVLDPRAVTHSLPVKDSKPVAFFFHPEKTMASMAKFTDILKPLEW
jgi:hypothetical protein